MTCNYPKMRLDRFIQRHTPHSKQTCKLILAAQRVQVNGELCTEARLAISEFCEICVDGQILQSRQAVYIMLHKPAGVVSSTVHHQHPTVLDCLPESLAENLHLAGRLDLKTTGLVLLTNDGQWSRRVTQPNEKVAKLYRVTTREPIAAQAQAVFAAGVYFANEDATTLPAELQIIDRHNAWLTLHEGRHHQVKRMFATIGNEVLSLHRERVGNLSLGDLAPGSFCELSSEQAMGLF